ncbi:MAG: acylphosphatase [Acidimicrobiales bacterium]
MDRNETRAAPSQLSVVLRRRLLVDGRVQGVGYRVSCARRARAAGLAGWVRNLADGSVEVVLQGPPDAVSEIEKWCRRGPQMAVVTSVEATEEPPTGDTAFAIR